MEKRMQRTLFASLVLAAAAAAVGAQEEGQNPYQGTSTPPQDEITVSSQAQPTAKPRAGRPLVQPQAAAQPAATALPAGEQGYEPIPSSAKSAPNDSGADEGVVQVEPAEQPATTVYRAQSSQPGLNHRLQPYDPDGDIVHPDPLRPGQIGEGTIIRVRLLGRISTAEAVSGESFRTRVASDVMQSGQVLIPAGAEIDGHIYQVSSGTAGGHGSMRLRPETVILPDGSRYRLYAQVTGAPGSKSQVGTEGVISAGSRYKRDGIEYGTAMGAGALTGAYMGGPVGALAGTLIGAGVISVHLLISHPQATLETGTPLLFTLTQRLSLVPSASSGE